MTNCPELPGCTLKLTGLTVAVIPGVTTVSVSVLETLGA
jgi:hypothetical protein